MDPHDSSGLAGPGGSISELIGDLVRDVAGLVRSEGRLVRAELTQSAKSVAGGIALIAAGALVLTVAALLLLQAVVIVVADWLGPLLASAVVGGVVAIIGVLLIVGGRSALTVANIIPERTLEQTSRDARLAKEQLK